MELKSLRVRMFVVSVETHLSNSLKLLRVKEIRYDKDITICINGTYDR